MIVVAIPAAVILFDVERQNRSAGIGDRLFGDEYGFARLVVTENGAAFADEISSDGRVHDVERVAFLRAHLQQMADVRRDGVPVDAYFAWSFLDNFEEIQGGMVPMKIRGMRGETLISLATFLDVEFRDEFEESEFAKP